MWAFSVIEETLQYKLNHPTHEFHSLLRLKDAYLLLTDIVISIIITTKIILVKVYVYVCVMSRVYMLDSMHLWQSCTVSVANFARDAAFS